MAVRYAPYPGKGMKGPGFDAGKGMKGPPIGFDAGKGPSKGYPKGGKLAIPPAAAAFAGKGMKGPGFDAGGKGKYMGPGGTLRLDDGKGKGPAPVKGAPAQGKGANPFDEGKGKGMQPYGKGKGKAPTTCKYFAMGVCTKGEECEFPHVGEFGAAAAGGVTLRKTKICKYFELGTCMNGAGCAYAHGPWELVTDPVGAAVGAAAAGPAYKSKICKYFEMGTCTGGGACKYAHGVHELSGGLGPPMGKGYGPPMLDYSGKGYGPPMLDYSAMAAGPPVGYKSKMCKYFLQGTCNNGPGCSFAHGPHEMGGGGGPGAWGPGPAVPMQGAMTRMCKFWEHGSCPQGRNCTFAHSEHELQSAEKGKGKGKGKENRNYKTMMCTNFLQNGTCPRSSEECMFAHGEEELQEYVASDREMQFAKSKLCKFYMAGNCSRGDECLYAHGEDQLMPVEFDAPQAVVYDHAADGEEANADNGFEFPDQHGL